MANFDLLSNHSLAGIADADGSFGIFFNKSKTHVTGFNLVLSFRLKQKYPELLYLVKTALGGNVYHLMIICIVIVQLVLKLHIMLLIILINTFY